MSTHAELPSTRGPKRSRRYFGGMEQGGGDDAMADMDYVLRWTMAVAASLSPIRTVPTSVGEEIRKLRKTGWRLTNDELECRACRIRWRIKTEWPRNAVCLLEALNRCVDDVRLTEHAVSSACENALFGEVSGAAAGVAV